MYNISPGIPTSYPADAMQCCIDCAEGTCTEPIEKKMWAHHVAMGYAAGQAVASGPCPCPGPCSVADFKTAHAALKSGGKAALPFNWLALLQLLAPMAAQLIQALLALLNPPAPAPAKKP